MEKETLIRPSLLSADFCNLGRDVEECIFLGITHIHFDVMDGTFVDDISFGEPIFQKLNAAYSSLVTFDVHLMTESPLRQVSQFARLGAREICFHFETLTLGDIPRIRQIRSQYPTLKIGIAFSLETKVDALKTILGFFDYVLVMSVVPGKGGQKFISGSEDKIYQLAECRSTFQLDYQIGVDGGINAETGLLCKEKGADFMVAGSYFFHAVDKKSALDVFHRKNVIK